MPSIAPELQLGILKASQQALVDGPRDAQQLNARTALFFLNLNGYHPFQKETYHLGRETYDDAAALDEDALAAVNRIRSFLAATAESGSHIPNIEETDKLVSFFKTLGNPTAPVTIINSAETLKNWQDFTLGILDASLTIFNFSNQLREKIEELERNLTRDQEYAARMVLLKREGKDTDDANDLDEIKKRNKLEKKDEEDRKPRPPIVTGVNVRNLIQQFEDRNKPKPLTTRTTTARKLNKNDDDSDGDDDLENRNNREAKDSKDDNSSDTDTTNQNTNQTQDDTTANTNSKRRSPVTMHQQNMAQSVEPVPTVVVTSVQEMNEILAAAKTLGDKKEVKEMNKLFSQFHQQALQASDPVARSLDLRATLLMEWNKNLLPLQTELLNRIATLEVVLSSLQEAIGFARNDPDANKVKAYLAEIDSRATSASNALDSYKLTLEEVNQIEVGLTKTNVTVYNDPDYEGLSSVQASVVKVLTGKDEEGKAALLTSMREDLGRKIDARNPNKPNFAVSTEAFEYEKAKIDTTRDYTLLGFIGSDTKSVNSPHDNTATVRLQSNLNTIYSLNASPTDRNDVSLQVLEIRDDLDPTHVMVKFVSDVHSKLDDMLPLFGNPSTADLYKLFSQLPKKIHDVKTLENFLAQHMEPNVNASPAKVAKAMHKELMRTLRNEKYPEVPCNEALRLAKDVVTNFLDKTDGKQMIFIHGQNGEMRRAIKYYCEMMRQQFKGHPEEQRKYDYFDDKDHFRPVVQASFWGAVKSAFIPKDPNEKPLLEGLNEQGRRVAKEIKRSDNVELDRQVQAKTNFTEEVAAHKARSRNLAVLTNTLQSTNNHVGSSGVLKQAVETARKNALGAQRLPEATTSRSP